MAIDLTLGACDTVYGPVDSRRHGFSLGINLGLSQTKVCTWGCVYCQCGVGQRRDFDDDEKRPSRAQVLDLVSAALTTNSAIDSITFAGNCEPTTHPEFAGVVEDLLALRQKRRGKWVINALSNGSELDRSEVVTGCNRLDQVWIKLDCGIPNLFQRLNRPISRLDGLQAHLSRLQRMDRLFLQTMFWKSQGPVELSNWTTANREALLDHYKALRPQVIHLTTVARVPAMPQIAAVPTEELEGFAEQLRQAGLIVSVFG